MLRARTPAWLIFVALAGCTPAAQGDPSSEPGAPTTLERFGVDSDGHPMVVWARRPPAPQAVVLLLHGRTWSSLPDFDLEVPGESLSLMKALAAKGIATYALDARGYGDTPRDETGWLTPDRMEADVAHVLRWVARQHPELPRPAVLGWSFGSTVAHLTAQRHPELLSGVALYGYWKNPTETLPVAEDPTEPPRIATTADGARSDFITPGAISERAVAAFVAAALNADPVRVDVRQLHQFNALSPDSLNVPTLILEGQFDPIAPAATQDALFNTLATGHKAWVVLPGCDHAAHLERCRARFVRSSSGFILEVAGKEIS